MTKTSASAPGAAAAAGKRRGGRRTKEAWRKNVDIADVERFLEEQRLDERLGRAEDKSDAELFTVDTRGEEDAATGDVGAQLAAPVSARLRRRAEQAAATPRCYLALEPTSQVADPNSKRNTVRETGSRPGDWSRASAARRIARGTPQRRAAESLAGSERARLERSARRTQRTHRQRFHTDVWSDEPELRRVAPSLRSEWLPAEAVQHHVPPARRVARPAPPRPARALPPALPPPHPGQSYNPSYQDHQALLAEVCDKERLLMKKEKHLERVTTALYKRVRPDVAQSEWVREIMAGLPPLGAAPDPAPAPESDAESGGEYAALNPPVANKKKDARARRRQREHKARLHAHAQAKLDKKKIADLYKLRFLEAALERAEARLARAREARSARRAARRAAEPPALNAHKHQQHEPDFLAPHELAPALRAHTHTGNLLRERFVSLQRRGALAPSRIFLRKKLRVKRYYKPGHKVTQQDVARRINRTKAPLSRSAATALQ